MFHFHHTAQYVSFFNLVEVFEPPPINSHSVESVCGIFGPGPVSALFEITLPSPPWLSRDTLIR